MGMVKDIWMPPHDSLPQKWARDTSHIPRDSQGISSQPKSWTLKRWDPPCALLLGLVGLSWTLDPLCFFVDNLTRAFFNVCWPFGMVPVSRTSKAFQDVLENQKLTFTSFHVAPVALGICMWSCCATSHKHHFCWNHGMRGISPKHWKMYTEKKHGPFFSQLVDVVLGQATSVSLSGDFNDLVSIKYLSSPRFCRAIVSLFLFQSFLAVDPFGMFLCWDRVIHRRKLVRLQSCSKPIRCVTQAEP